jgi:hypothetical protein
MGIIMKRIRPHTLVRTTAWTILSAAVSLAAPARAQMYDSHYPVCLQVYDDMVHYSMDCSFTSLPQCAASASGRGAQCIVNPYYAPPQGKPHPRRKHSQAQ